MDASMQDYIWNGYQEFPVDTSAWKTEDWLAQINLFLSRHRTAMDSWRGFREIPELIAVRLKERHQASEVVFQNTVTGASGFGAIPSNVHARIIDCLFSVVEQETIQEFLVLTRKAFWARLLVAHHVMPTAYHYKVNVSRWHLSYLEDSGMKSLLAESRHFGASILRMFRQIMVETEDALQIALDDQHAARIAYDKVLSRMSKV